MLPDRNRSRHADINELTDREVRDLVRQSEQESRREKARAAAVADDVLPRLKELEQIFNESADEAALRIEIDKALAKKMQAVVDDPATPLEDAMALGRMATIACQCHQSGVAGLRPDGNLIVLHDHKCPCAILCPWAAREESMRLDAWYCDFALALARSKPTTRAFYIVFTDRNSPAGQLAAGQRQMYTDIEHWLKDQFTPIEQNPDYISPARRPLTRNGTPRRMKKKHTRPFRQVKRNGQKFKAWPNIKGMLCVMESPLSRHRDWHIHVNAIVIVDGAFDWDWVRATWGRNLYIEEIDRTKPEKMRDSLRELVKYSAMHMSVKQHLKPDEACSPGLVDYTHAEFLEFYQAHKELRRTRSYGALHSVERKQWEAADRDKRLAWCIEAGVDERYAEHAKWAAGKDEKWADRILWRFARNKIRRAMRNPDPVDLQQVKWVGFTHYRDGRYCLDLPALNRGVAFIPGHNFSNSSKETRQLRGFWRDTGPP